MEGDCGLPGGSADKIIVDKISFVCPINLESDDGGLAMTADLESGGVEENGIWFKMISWDTTKQHEIIKQFEGQVVRITVEVLKD